MRRCLLLLFGIGSALTAAGQNPDGGVRFWGEDSTEHLLVWVDYGLSLTPRIFVDYGQPRGGGPLNRLVKDATGHPLRFTSIVAALNYFSKRGFEVIGVSTDSPGNDREYLLRRKKSPP